MFKLKFVAGLLLISGLLMYTTDDAFSQRKPRGGGGWGMNSQYVRLFNPNTMVTIKGTVTAIDKFKPRNGMSYGIHLKVKSSDNEVMWVHLGPAWFITNQETQIKVGDEIELNGSKVTYNDKPVIIASELHMGDKVLMLRDNKGIPKWAGWRMRQQ